MATDNDDTSRRFNNAVEQAVQRDPVAIPVLIDALNHELWVIRNYHAHRALLLLGDAAVSSLLSVAQTTTIAAAVAAHTLYKIDAEAQAATVFATLERCLDAEPAVREEAVFVLFLLGKEGSSFVPRLTALLRDTTQTERCREGAARALQAMEALIAADAPALLALLHANTWETRFQGGVGLETLGEAAPRPALAALVVDTSALLDARLEAIQVLGAVGGGAKALTAALRDPSAWIRLYAARSLGKTQPRGVARALGAALDDPSVEVRRNVLWALAQLRAKSLCAAPALVELLRDPTLGGIAAEALTKVGGRALPHLESALLEPGIAGQRAAYALSNMRGGRRRCAQWQAETGDTPYHPSPADLFEAAPTITLTPEKEAHFATLLSVAAGGLVPFDGLYPKYEFLYWAVQRQGCVLHGSNRTNIDILRPVRKSLEAESGNPKGNINGVYATPDEIWPLFFATIDRGGHSVGMMNGPFETEAGKFYLFSINVESLRAQAYTDGMVYLLPGETFENATGAERASRVPVAPIARLAVSPTDQPFLAQMRGFDTRNPAWPRLERFPLLDEIAKMVVRSQPEAEGNLAPRPDGG